MAWSEKDKERGYAFEEMQGPTFFDDTNPEDVLVRVAWEPDGWKILWNKAYLDQLRSGEASIEQAYRLVDSIRDSIVRMLKAN